LQNSAVPFDNRLFSCKVKKGMKTVIKPKQGWRLPIGALIRSAMEAPPEALPFAALAETVTIQQRSWLLRSPLSSWSAPQEAPPKLPKRQLRAGSRKTRLPSLAARRTTLIDIIKTKQQTTGEPSELVEG
jgi:hypothetical protein